MIEAARKLASALHALNSRWQPHAAQQRILNAIFRDQSSSVFVECGRKFGKMLALDTPIPTPRGWRTMGDLKEGDQVFDERGMPCNVTQAHPIDPSPESYVVRFSDGEEIRACGDHQWLTSTKQARRSAKRNLNDWGGRIQVKPAIVSTNEIKETLQAGKEWNHSIPCTLPLEYDAKMLPIDPYVLGVWLGDGNSHDSSITTIDPEILVEIRNAGYEIFSPTEYPQYHRIYGLNRQLRAMSLLKNKHVPSYYLRGSVAQRLALLQGLMDTDGTISAKGACEFSNTNDNLADAVHELVLSLGMKVRRAVKKTTHKDCHRVHFTPTMLVFRLPRKVKRIEKTRRKPMHRFIVAVEPIDPIPMRCISVDSPSRLYLCGRGMIPTHNSETIAYFLWRLALLRPGGYYYFAPEQKQAKEIIWASGRIQDFGPPEMIDGKPNDSEMRIWLRNGSFIKVDGSDNFNSHRGTEPHGVAYDEYRDFRPEFHRAFGANLLVYKAPLLICGTPPEPIELDHYDAMRDQHEIGKDRFVYPTWMNPYIDRDWLRRERDRLIARGETDVWQREYEAKRVIGGSNAIFPMFSRAKFVRPHAAVMAELERDKTRLIWQVICDPGNASVFGVLFRAINPYTRTVYRLAEIYEKDQAETSTSRIVPRIKAMKDELCPDWRALRIDWEQHYDEAATWFATEALNSFGEHFTPTQKAMRDKDQGLSLMKDQMLHGLTVVSDRCTNFVKEIEGYIRDKNGKIPKGNDHLIDCIAGFELVTTSQGLVEMQRLRPGDLVLTRSGFKPIEAHWCVGKRQTIRLLFSDGRTLTCTPDHMIYTKNRGFVRANELNSDDSLDSFHIGGRPWSKRSSSTGSSFAATQILNAQTTETTTGQLPTLFALALGICIERYGKQLTAPFQRGITSITKMATHLTTRLITSNVSLSLSTCESITSGLLRQPYWRISTGFGRWPLLGTGQTKAGYGTLNMAPMSWLFGNLNQSSAISAAGATRANIRQRGFAQITASLHGGARLASTLSRRLARFAAKVTCAVNTLNRRQHPTALRLVRAEAVGLKPVYDLKVHGEPEFYANGILVHNCDRYGNDFASCDLTPVEPPKAKDRDLMPRFRTPEQDLQDASGSDFELDY